MRWDAVSKAIADTAAADPLLASIFGDKIWMAGSAEHQVPLLEYQLVADGAEGELWDPCVFQWDIWHQNGTTVRQAERRLRLLFHTELPFAIGGVGMWSQCTGGFWLASPSRDGYYGRAVRFQHTPLREIYDRSGTP